MEKKVWYIILILGIITGLILHTHLMIVKPSFNIINYNGVPRDSEGSVPSWWTTQSMGSSTTFTIGDYKVVTTKYDEYATKYCKPLPKNHNANDYTECANQETSSGMINYNEYHPILRTCSFLSEATDSYGCTVQNYSCSGYSQTYYCGCSDAGCGACYCNNPYFNKLITFGGQTISTSSASGYVNYGCSELVKIYKNGELINTIGELAGNAGTTLHSSTSWTSPDNTLHLLLNSPNQYQNRECEYVANQIIYDPLGLINITTLDKNISLIKGVNAKIRVLVNNKLPYSIKGVLVSEVCAPGFFGPQCKDFTNNITLGANSQDILSLEVPIHTSNNVTITNSINVGVDINSLGLSGVNYACNPADSKMHSVDWCENNGYTYYHIGTVTDSPYKVELIAEPELVQCFTSADCVVPTSCVGVTASCINNKCVLSGECIIPPKEQNIWDLINNKFQNILKWIIELFKW